MEIVEKGNLPEEDNLKGDCPKCRTKVNFKRKELQRDSYGLYWKCPTCTIHNSQYTYGSYPKPSANSSLRSQIDNTVGSE